MYSRCENKRRDKLKENVLIKFCSLGFPKALYVLRAFSQSRTTFPKVPDHKLEPSGDSVPEKNKQIILR